MVLLTENIQIKSLVLLIIRNNKNPLDEIFEDSS